MHAESKISTQSAEQQTGYREEDVLPKGWDDKRLRHDEETEAGKQNRVWGNNSAHFSHTLVWVLFICVNWRHTQVQLANKHENRQWPCDAEKCTIHITHLVKLFTFAVWNICLAHRKESVSFFVSDLMSKYILVGSDWSCRKTNQKGTMNLRIAYKCFFSRRPRYLLNSVCLMTTNYVSISIGPPTQGTLVKSLHKIACITFPSLMASKVTFINMFA